MIQERFDYFCSVPSDINEHLPVLKSLAGECEHVTEMGVRNVVSTWALLYGLPKFLRCYDIHRSENINPALSAAKDAGIDMRFIEADVLKIEIEKTDMLFIDTLHTYTQLKRELDIHAGKVSKYLVFHDVETYGTEPEPASWQTPEIMENYVQNDKGIMSAINEFMVANPQWIVKNHYKNNNGLLVLEKK